MLRIALKCHAGLPTHTIFATALPWGKERRNAVPPPDVSDAYCRRVIHARPSRAVPARIYFFPRKEKLETSGLTSAF